MPTILEKSQYSGNISSLYSRLAWIYDLFTDHEPAHHRVAVGMAGIKPWEAILEVACGTGRATLEIARQIAEGNKLFAVDLTEAMIQKAKKKLERERLLNKVKFTLADAKALPFPDTFFDMLYNAYMFDLIDLSEIPKILLEFKRVLKSEGRLVLVNMSKNTDTKTLYEVLYEKGLLSFASGSCRPVLLEEYVKEAGFQKVQRFYRKNRSWFPLNWLHGTEIIIAHKQQLNKRLQPMLFPCDLQRGYLKYKEIIKIDSENFDAHWKLARTIQYIEKFSAPLTYIFLADTYLALKNKDLAKRSLEKLIDMASDPRWVPETKRYKEIAKEMLEKIKIERR